MSNIGKTLLETGAINSAQAEKILQLQKELGLKFGEAGIKLGFFNEQDVQQALSRQFSYPYLDSATSKLSSKLIAAFSPFDSQVEKIRSLRSQVILRGIEQGNKGIVFVKNESIGSELIANLAIVFSQMGERTLLIDADLRAPKQHALFAIENRNGLCDVLAGRVSFDQVVQCIGGLLDLSVLTAGSQAPNPQELLSKDSMATLVEHVKENFDVILVDSSSASLSSDFQMLIHRLKGVVIFAERNVSNLKQLQTLKENCLVAGGHILGCVLLDEQR